MKTESETLLLFLIVSEERKRQRQAFEGFVCWS